MNQLRPTHAEVCSDSENLKNETQIKKFIKRLKSRRNTKPGEIGNLSSSCTTKEFHILIKTLCTQIKMINKKLITKRLLYLL
jgi:hypothetical protein